MDFYRVPVDQNQWVKSVEYVSNGQTYSQSFDLGPLHNDDNYQYCGVEMEHTIVPTPTPGDLPRGARGVFARRGPDAGAGLGVGG